jgi:hypothetical protein
LNETGRYLWEETGIAVMVVAVVVGLSAKLEQGSQECGHTRVIPRCYRNSNDTRARMVEECLSNPSTDTFIFLFSHANKAFVLLLIHD